MRRFFIGLYGLTGVLHVPFVFVLQALLQRAGIDWSWLIAGCCGLLLWWLFHGRMTLLRWDRPLSRLRAVAEEAYFVHWCALAAWFPAAVLVALGLELTAAPVLATALSWSQQVLLFSYPPALLIALWAVVVRRRLVRVRTIVVPLANLPVSSMR